jgi:maleylacetate reductase
MRAFSYTALPTRVVFGPGKLAGLADEITRLQLTRVVVLSTPGQADLAQRVALLLGPLGAGIYAKAVMHVPEAVANAAIAQVRALGADGIVAVGGGSTIGLGKAITLQTDLPLLAVPTTYSGSEMTPIWGLTRDGVKITGRDTRVLPKTVIYDARLSLSLPPAIAATSGMNAIAHCVEGLYAKDANPVSSLMAEEGIRALALALPAIRECPEEEESRSLALYGAWLSGCVLGAVGMALHHKICHTLGGSFNLPHADVHTVMIPYVTAFNRTAAPEAMAAISRALGTQDAALGLHALALRLQAPLALRDIGMREQDLDRAAELATSNPYYNPRDVNRDNVRALLQAAFEGQAPA